MYDGALNIVSAIRRHFGMKRKGSSIPLFELSHFVVQLTAVKCQRMCFSERWKSHLGGAWSANCENVIGTLVSRPVLVVSAELALLDHSCRGRDSSAHQPRIGLDCARTSQAARTPCSCKPRNSLGCNSSGISPISRRGRASLSANSKRAIFRPIAPVKAPSQCPNHSLSVTKGIARN